MTYECFHTLQMVPEVTVQTVCLMSYFDVMNEVEKNYKMFLQE
jgi:hypothetical protein